MLSFAPLKDAASGLLSTVRSSSLILCFKRSSFIFNQRKIDDYREAQRKDWSRAILSENGLSLDQAAFSTPVPVRMDVFLATCCLTDFSAAAKFFILLEGGDLTGTLSHIIVVVTIFDKCSLKFIVVIIQGWFCSIFPFPSPERSIS